MYVLNKRTSLLCQAGSSLIIEHTWVSLFLYISETYFLEEVKKEYKAKEKRDEIFVSLFYILGKSFPNI